MDTAVTEFPIECTEPSDALSKIMQFEQCIRSMELQDLPLQHWFPKGMYARQIFLPKGSPLVSHVHKSEHLSVLMQGDITITSENGSTKRIQAPQVFVTYPGTKRAVYAHEDTLFMTVHICEARTVEEAENELVVQAWTVEAYQAVLADLASAKQIEHVEA